MTTKPVTPFTHGVFSSSSPAHPPLRLFTSKPEALDFLKTCGADCFYAPVEWIEDRNSITGYDQRPAVEGRVYRESKPLPPAFINFAGYLHDRFRDESEYEDPAEYDAAWLAFCKKHGADIGMFRPKVRGSLATVILDGTLYTLKINASKITEMREPV
jgi:hypothetical protein